MEIKNNDITVGEGVLRGGFLEDRTWTWNDGKMVGISGHSRNSTWGGLRAHTWHVWETYMTAICPKERKEMAGAACAGQWMAIKGEESGLQT